MRRIAPLLGSIYLVFLGWYGARHFGENWRRDLLLALLGPYAALSVLGPLYERHVRREIDAADPEDVAARRRADPEFDAFIEDRPRVNERSDWVWRATDIAGGLAFALYLPLIYTQWRYRELTGDTPFDGLALTLLIAGAGAYLGWRRRRLRTYRCPRCRQVTVRLSGETIRRSCRGCGVTWRLGQPVVGDGARPT